MFLVYEEACVMCLNIVYRHTNGMATLHARIKMNQWKIYGELKFIKFANRKYTHTNREIEREPHELSSNVSNSELSMCV